MIYSGWKFILFLVFGSMSPTSYAELSQFCALALCGEWGGGGDRGAGARENRGREGYGRREKKGREAGSLRWREAGEKFKKAVKETNPTTFLDFHFTFSEA